MTVAIENLPRKNLPIRREYRALAQRIADRKHETTYIVRQTHGLAVTLLVLTQSETVGLFDGTEAVIYTTVPDEPDDEPTVPDPWESQWDDDPNPYEGTYSEE